ESSDHISHLWCRCAGPDRLSAFQRIFQQGRNSRGRLRTQHADLRGGFAYGFSDGLLRYPLVCGRLFRQRAQRNRPQEQRIARGDDRPADRARASSDVERVCVLRAELPSAPSREEHRAFRSRACNDCLSPWERTGDYTLSQPPERAFRYRTLSTTLLLQRILQLAHQLDAGISRTDLRFL